jgi:sugar transferase (PEP-CTERM/EpsH1 system associated)
VRDDLLFLAHRIPYPPDKGDKIRSFRLLERLARSYRVQLGAFVDDPADWRHEPALRQFCADLCLRPLPRRTLAARALGALARGRPVTTAAYADPGLRAWVGARLDAGVRRALVFSSAVAPYLMAAPPGVRRVLDMVDVDSEKWRDYGAAGGGRGPRVWLHRREARLLLDFERRAAAAFDATLFVSRAEADLFRRLAPEVAGRVGHLTNGVDAEHALAPDPSLPDPYAGRGRDTVLFTGAMDYAANVEAVVWFARVVLPALRRRRPEVRFVVCGARPTRRVRALARESPGVVTVTGRVADVRPYLQHAACAVAPLRVARGIQNKVLEAMAMAKPTVVTPEALRGLGAEPGREVLVADGADAFVGATLAALDAGAAAPLGARARAWVRREHRWDACLDGLEALIEGTDATAAAAALA